MYYYPTRELFRCIVEPSAQTVPQTESYPLGGYGEIVRMPVFVSCIVPIGTSGGKSQVIFVAENYRSDART